METNAVSTFYIDRQGDLWVAYRPGTLSLFSPEQQKFIPMLPGMSLFITHINELQDGRLLLMTRNHGFYIFDKNSGEYQHFSTLTHREKGLLTDRYQHSFFDHHGQLWLGSFDSGLMGFDIETESVTEHYSNSPGESTTLPSNLILSLQQTSEKGLWVGTNAGLSFFDFAQKNFRTFDIEEGLPDETIYAILPDEKGNLWLPTNQGMVVFDPQSDSFRQFTTEDGLPNDEFNSNAHVLLNNTLYSGSIGGLVKLDLNRTPAPLPEVETRLISLFIGGEEVLPETLSENLTSPIIEANRLNLGYGQKVFSLFFSALEFETPLKLGYRYRLSPFDDDWRYVNSQRRVATYTNLDAGNYLFEVQSSSEQGAWGKIRELNINVEAHPLNTLTAYLFYVLASLSVVGYITYLILQRQHIKAEAFSQLQSKEQQLSFALWGSGDEVWNIDLSSGKLIRQNPLSEACYREEQSWDKGYDNSDYIHPDDAAKVTEAVNECLSGKNEVFQQTYRMKNKEGGWFWVLDKGKVTEYQDGKPMRLSGAIKNIDKLKKAEEKLAQINAELESRVKERTLVLQLTNKELTETVEELKNTQGQLVEAEKLASLGSMVAGISHEINTPLGVALTAVTHVDEGAKDLFNQVESNTLSEENYHAFKQEMSNGIELTLRNLRRASELITSFKQVSVDQSAENKREFYLRELLVDTIRMMHPKLKQKAHQIHLHCEQDFAMDSYPGALSQVLINLINNSIIHGFKHLSSGEINIAVKQEKEHMLICYQDNGCGIKKDDLSNIFAPFFTTNRSQGSTGLGMHISYNLITQKLLGTINVASSPGKGVEFSIKLPTKLAAL